MKDNFIKINTHLLNSLLESFPNKEKIIKQSIDFRAKRSDRIYIFIGLLNSNQLTYINSFCEKNELKYVIHAKKANELILDIYEPFKLY